jgi:hypothetical protein
MTRVLTGASRPQPGDYECPLSGKLVSLSILRLSARLYMQSTLERAMIPRPERRAYK